MSESRKAPFHKAIKRAWDELGHLDIFIKICSRALHLSSKATKMIDLLQEGAELLNLEGMTEEEALAAKKEAIQIESFALKQAENGFPYLFNLGVVRLWSIIEAVVDEIVIDFMLRPNECKDKDLIYRLKGPLLEFSNGSMEQKAVFLAETLKDTVKARLKLGIGRFEPILEPIGLGGPVDPNLKEILFELSQIRNAIVHKSGIADKRIVEGCPWLNLKPGMMIKIKGQNFYSYLMAAYCYVGELRLRLHHHSGYEKPETLEDFLQNTKDFLKEIVLSGSHCLPGTSNKKIDG